MSTFFEFIGMMAALFMFSIAIGAGLVVGGLLGWRLMGGLK